MKKKLMSAILFVTMAVNILSGCSGNNNVEVGGISIEGNNKYKEFITIDVFDSQANYQGIQSGWFAKIVKEKFNMELNIIAPNVAGGGDTLFQTRSAAGELGDLIITGANNGRLQNMVTAGLVVDMTELLKNAENIHNFKNAIENTSKLVKEDGIWAIPSEVSLNIPTTGASGLEPTFGPYLRWDAYKAIGYPKISTLEDLTEVLKQMQEAIPESDTGKKTYAISLFKDWDGNLMNNAKQPTCFYGYDEIGFVLAKADGSNYQSIIDSDSEYVRVLKFFYNANQMGLVDPESTTQNYDTMFAKYQDGAILYAPWPWLGQAAYNTEKNKNEGKGFMIADIEDMTIFEFGSQSNGNANNCIMIGSKAKDPERLADFIDWLYSPEGIMCNSQQTSAACGPEGLTWEMVDGEPMLTDFGKKALYGEEVNVPEEWGGGSWKDGVSALNYRAVSQLDINPENGFCYSHTKWESELLRNITALDKDWQDKMGASTTEEFLVKNNKMLVAPGSGYVVPEEDSQITTLRGQCKSIIIENSWRMIFAGDDVEFFSILKHMQETVIGLGYHEVLEYDMKTAKDQNDARVAVAEQYK